MNPRQLRIISALQALLLACGAFAPSIRAGEPPVPRDASATQPQELLVERGRLDQDAKNLRVQGKLAEAIAALEQKLAKEREAYGHDHAIALATLGQLAELHEACDDLAAARKVWEEVLATRTRLAGAKHWQATDARLGLARLTHLEAMTPAQRQQVVEAAALRAQVKDLGDKGKNAEALPLAQRALELRRELLGEEDPDAIMSLKDVGWMLRDLARHDEAEPLLRRTVELRKKVLGEDHPEYGYSLNVLGWLYFYRNDYSESESCFRQALAVYEQAGDEKSADHAMTLNNLGEISLARDEFDRATEWYLQALAVRKRSVGDKHSDYARSLRDLAAVHLIRGDFVQAEHLLRQAQTILQETLGERHRDYFWTLNGLANVYQSQGDYAQAEAMCRELVTLFEEHSGKESEPYANALHNLAVVCKKHGNLDEAERLHREALAIRERILGEIDPDIAYSYGNLGLLLLERGEFAEAEKCQRRALEIRKQLYGASHSEYASSLEDLAAVEAHQGKFKEAEQLYRQARDLYLHSVGEGANGFAICTSGLGLLYMRQQDFAQAEPLLRQTLELSRQRLDLATAVQSERQQLALNLKLRCYLDDYLSLDQQHPLPAADVYRWVLMWKGSVLAQQQHLRQLRAVPQLAPQAEKLQTVSAELARLFFAGADSDDPDARRKRIAELTQQKEALESELAQASSEFRRQQAEQRLTPTELQAALPSDVVLVDFLEYVRRAPDPEQPGRWVKERCLSAFVVRHAGEISRIDLGKSAPIDEAVAAWRSTLQRSRPVENDNDPARVLRRLVWEPLETHLDQAATVLISPDGALNDLPFAALPGKDDSKYLLEEQGVAVVPVPQCLPELLNRPQSADGDQDRPSMLAIGNVDYDAEHNAPKPKPTLLAGDASSSRRRRAGAFQQWKPLPSTRVEALSVTDSFHKAEPEGRLKLLTSADASETAVRIEAPRHRYLHLATHGFFASETVQSALGLVNDQAAAGTDFFGRDGVAGFHPGLLSGVVLAGGNRPASETSPDDGVLTALEVSDLDLRGVELTVLSACQTGRGRTAGGEGVLGLQRAFQVAGAKTVVTSLWDVSDDATSALMIDLYENYWSKEMGMLESLRTAQLEMLREGPRRGLVEVAEDAPVDRDRRAPPYYWAAFVLSGDWR